MIVKVLIFKGFKQCHFNALRSSGDAQLSRYCYTLNVRRAETAADSSEQRFFIEKAVIATLLMPTDVVNKAKPLARLSSQDHQVRTILVVFVSGSYSK